MNNGNLADFLLAICLITIFLILTISLIYLTQSRKIQRLRKVIIPQLLSELERNCDLLLVTNNTGESYFFSNHWSQLSLTAAELGENIQCFKDLWIYRQRGSFRSMRRVVTRMEAITERLTAYNRDKSVEFTLISAHVQAVVDRLREKIITLRDTGQKEAGNRIRDERNSGSVSSIHEVPGSASSVVIAIPSRSRSRSVDRLPVVSEYSVRMDFTECNEGSTQPNQSDLELFRRPGTTSFRRPGVLPCGFLKTASAHVSLNQRGDDSKIGAGQLPSILDLTPHRKHRAIVKVGSGQSGNNHAVMRAAKYQSLRRRDIVYAS